MAPRDPAVEALADALDRGLKRAQLAIEQAARRNASLLGHLGQVSGASWLGDLAQLGIEPALAKMAESRHARHLAKKHAHWLARQERRRLARLEKQREREARRRARHFNPTAAGLVMLAFAAAMSTMAFMDHQMWWLIFPAFGAGVGGAGMLGAPRGPAKLAKAPAADPRDARVDAVCARISAELGSAKPAVKDLVGQSAKSIEQLRLTCHSLTQRERELRELVNPEQDTRLLAEREALAARVEREPDSVVRVRLQGALEQLDEQRKERGAMAVAAARFEAEHTRIAYTLESLHAQVVRMKSADSASADPAAAAVRQSLHGLGEDLDALADALESVNRGELAPADESATARARDRA